MQENNDGNMELLGVGDLAVRWDCTRQNIYRRMRLDNSFPISIAIINGATYVFTLEQIEKYDLLRSGRIGSCGAYCQSREEWFSKSEEERDRHK